MNDVIDEYHEAKQTPGTMNVGVKSGARVVFHVGSRYRL